MDGWMNTWRDDWMDGKNCMIDRWMGGWLDGCTVGLMDGWTESLIDG